MTLRVSSRINLLCFNTLSNIVEPTEVFKCTGQGTQRSIIDLFDEFNSQPFEEWDGSICSASFNSTHFKCSCEEAALISINQKDINVAVLKGFFIGFIGFLILSMYC